MAHPKPDEPAPKAGRAIEHVEKSTTFNLIDKAWQTQKILIDTHGLQEGR